ncbi:MAG TPA: hypothetical protein VMA71_07425 [Alloacidobacterium sp.]|nr:hypothetical protein [Alloacidobacterium sp.]
MSDTRKTQDGKTMNCEEFQEKLPELFESGANVSRDEHVLGCENCAALVRDLEYIAAQAKLLLPIHDPSPSVWDNIQSAIRSDADPKHPVSSGKQP